jgi:hypothetical protein
MAWCAQKVAASEAASFAMAASLMKGLPVSFNEAARHVSSLQPGAVRHGGMISKRFVWVGWGRGVRWSSAVLHPTARYH